MPLSKSRHYTKSPIGKVPYDILLEIFVHCLPKHPFEIRQPNTRIAPILLCHVCSPWRTAALTSLILWSHLSICLTAWDIDEELGGWAFLQNEIECILWWKKNQSPIAPYLRLDIKIDDEKSGCLIGGDGMAFVMKYVTSAQYLEIDPIFWDQVQAIFETGDWVTFPNLHTLVSYQSNYSIDHSFYPMQVLIGRESIYTPSVLRQLAIVNDETSFFSPTTIPAHWSTLTHLSIATYRVSLGFWIPLTSVAPCLQWVYIAFEASFDDEKNINSIKCILPQLSTLFIESGGDNYVFNPLFANLYLPVLSNLLLSYHFSGQWWDHRGISDVYTALQSAPAIRKLTLRKHNVLTPAEIDYSTGTPAAVRGVVPIWSYVPHLVHLQLELFITRYSKENEAEKTLDIFARSAFFSNNCWLNLKDPACPIKTITVIDYTHLKTSSIRKCAGNASNIALKIISELYTDFEDFWKEWHSGN